MAEASVERTALASAPSALRVHGNPAFVELREGALRAMYDLRLEPTDRSARWAAEAVLRLTLPIEPNTSAAGGARSALWLGPDQWLIVAAEGEAIALERALAEREASVVDVSDLRAIFELEGPRAADVLRKGCAIDFHPRVFGPGSCVTTMFARVRAAIRQLDGSARYEIYVERSYADYLWAWLVDAMVEYSEG
jgi:sarcosine oxidase subunit gamma